MTTKEQKNKLKLFFQALDRVTHGPGEDYDLGLVISDVFDLKQIVKLIPRSNKVEVFKLSKKIHPDEYLKFLIKSFKNKKWCLIKLEDGYLPSRIYNQLRLLSIQNRLQIFNLGNQEQIDIKMPEQSRIAFLVSQKQLSKINNPNFINLFGPIIRV